MFPVSESENKETLNPEELTEQYWLQKLKAANNDKLQELAGTTQGTREELELIAASKFVKKAKDINATPYKYNLGQKAQELRWLEEEITEESWQEQQNRLKSEYYDGHKSMYYHLGIHELKCKVCDRVFYATSPFAMYCNYWCKVDRYIERRRQLHGYKRWKGRCQYCNKEFVSSRVHAKYCCNSHRVLACLE